MTTASTPPTDQTFFAKVGPGALALNLQRTGKLPPVSLLLTPLNANNDPNPRPQGYLDRFLSYQFNSSVLVPVDTFSFTFAAPDDTLPINQRIKVGDQVTLQANAVNISTGIIDQVEVETDRDSGERITISGRNMLSQLEDQECVNPDSSQVYGNRVTLSAVMNLVLNGTRISPSVVFQQAPVLSYLFATEPGESKLAAIQRFLEPLNCIIWMAPSGQIKIGKPAMGQTFQASVFISRKDSNANCMDMRVTRNGTQIPNLLVPMLAGTESVQSTLGKQQAIVNPAIEPTRLRNSGHITTKVVVTSYPNSGDTSEAPVTNNIIVAQQQSGGLKPALLQSYALREMARQNVNEIQVQATVPGHYDDTGLPYLPDSTYRIFYDRGDVDEIMYLYEVQYMLDLDGGQRSTLHFCRLNTIVSQQVAR